MELEVAMGCGLVGAGIGLMLWAGEGYFGPGIDFIEADFKEQLRRLRRPTKSVRGALKIWWTLLFLLMMAFWLVFAIPLFGLMIVASLFAFPWYLVRRWAHQRHERIEDQLADSMVTMSSSIKAGLSLAQALEILARQSPTPIREEFGQIVAEYQMGKTLDRCLDETRTRLRSENFALFAAAMQANREGGGRLSETVERIAISVREMQRLDRKVAAETAQARASAFYMALVPLGILATYYFFVDPVNTERLFTTVIGQIFLSVSLLFNITAYLWARKILSPDI